jgi:hypothetical protein
MEMKKPKWTPPSIIANRRRKEKERRDMVNHPCHYGGDMPHEVIKCLNAWGLESDALLWNAAKYIARAHLKGNKLEDLRKGLFYLARRIASLEQPDKSTEK